MGHVLIVLALLTGYGLFVLVKPARPCGKCSGWGHRTRRRGPSACGRCKGTGKQFLPGARLAHRGAVLAITHLRERKERES